MEYKGDFMASNKHYKSLAFTLAEVLITLGIVGVVAAMTIPTLMHNYRAKEMRTRLLRANSIIQDGIGRMVADEVNISELMQSRDYNVLRKYFKDGGCLVPKNASQGNYKNYFGNMNTSSAAIQKVIWPPYCLNDGMLLWFAQLNEWSNNKLVATDYTILLVDINGWQNLPNKYGIDVFFWIFNPEDSRVHPIGKSASKSLDVLRRQSTYYITCPGDTGWAEAGIGCTESALSDESYFKKLKF